MDQLHCLHCHSDNTKKHGKIGKGTRYRCGSCHHTFCVGTTRGTYKPDFKEKVAEQYCHDGKTAQEIINLYKISTATLISWSKKHQSKCSNCLSCKPKKGK